MHKIYRVLRGLSTGHIPGQVVRGKRFKTQDIIDALIGANAIAEISCPPLDKLPGWKLKSGKLKKLGIITVNDFLIADIEHVARELGYKQRTIKRWHKEIEEVWLLAITSPESK
jgi:hypothetical protein